MSIFLLPSSLSDEIEKIMNSFWWGHNCSGSKGMNWISWDRLSMAKKDKGVGFKNLSVFNYAMLGKQAWNIMMKPYNDLAGIKIVNLEIGLYHISMDNPQDVKHILKGKLWIFLNSWLTVKLWNPAKNLKM